MLLVTACGPPERDSPETRSARLQFRRWRGGPECAGPVGALRQCFHRQPTYRGPAQSRFPPLPATATGEPGCCDPRASPHKGATSRCVCCDARPSDPGPAAGLGAAAKGERRGASDRRPARWRDGGGASTV